MLSITELNEIKELIFKELEDLMICLLVIIAVLDQI